MYYGKLPFVFGYATGGLEIHSVSTSVPAPRPNLARSIRQMMKGRSTFQRDGSLRALSVRGIEASFTIAMDDAYDYNILGDIDLDDLHEELARHTTEVCELMQNLTPSHDAAVDDYLCADVTLKLCQAIFRGEEIPDDIGERDDEYTAIRQDLLRRNLPAGTQFVLRSRREIVQHAKAASYIISELYLRGKDLTEDIILETHRILTDHVDTEQGISWTEYSGVYRHDNVRGRMKAMISDLNSDLKEATKSDKIDAVAFSAKYCHNFVNIHSFLDGNGRTCRLILNAMLLLVCHR
ncbi:Fido domain containing protein [Elaphomyces granulatus]